MKKNKIEYRVRYDRILLFIVIPLLVVCLGLYLFFHVDKKEKQEKEAAIQAEQHIFDKEKLQLKAQKALEQERDAKLLMLVNKENPLTQAFVPQEMELVNDFVRGKPKSILYMEKEACGAMNEMTEAAKGKELTLLVTNAYRPYAMQESMFASNTAIKGSEIAANATSARAGESEHQTGLVADLTTPDVGKLVTLKFADSLEGKWVAKNAHLYGFIIRYPKGKEEVTGYEYEPWHVRYVGKNHAKQIYEGDSTLEEYLKEK